LLGLSKGGDGYIDIDTLMESPSQTGTGKGIPERNRNQERLIIELGL
jgi:hypothetical protein